MHDELQTLLPEPLGLAFEIPDLLLAQATAAALELRLVVETDHHSECEELEEVLALYAAQGDACHWLIWRDTSSVVVQPIPGRSHRFPCLANALDWLAPDKSPQVSDILPGVRQAWPSPEQPAATPTTRRQGGGRQLHPAEG